MEIFNTLFTRISKWLTDRENHRAYSEYQNHLLAKTVVFKFINCYISLYYIAFFKNKSQLFGMAMKCVNDDCLEDYTIICCTVLLYTLPYHAIPYYTITIPYHTIPLLYHTILYHYHTITIPYHTTPHHTILQDLGSQLAIFMIVKVTLQNFVELAPPLSQGYAVV